MRSIILHVPNINACVGCKPQRPGKMYMLSIEYLLKEHCWSELLVLIFRLELFSIDIFHFLNLPHFVNYFYFFFPKKYQKYSFIYLMIGLACLPHKNQFKVCDPICNVVKMK